MSLCYHVQRTAAAPFKVGKSYTFGAEQNFFIRDLFSTDVRVPVRGIGGLPIDSVLKDYFDPAGFKHYQQIKRAGCTADDRGLLSCAAAVLNHQALLLRELIFEDVRRDSFPDKPSRMRCIWLIPHEERILAQWVSTAPRGQFRVFEVEAEGNLHVGAGKYLQPACLSATTLRENARRFWSEPVVQNDEGFEILCTGNITVLRELRMEGSRNTVWTKLGRLF